MDGFPTIIVLPSRTDSEPPIHLSYGPAAACGFHYPRGRPGEVEELLSLISAASGQPAIKSTSLYFPRTSAVGARADGYVLTLEEWKELFVTLLTAVIDKGCELLWVTGGQARMFEPQVPAPLRRIGWDWPSALKRGAKATLSVLAPRMFPTEVGSSDDDDTTTKLGTKPAAAQPVGVIPDGSELRLLQSNLKSVNLKHSEFLLVPPLVEWTITLLNHSSSLHTLAICFFAPAYTWSTLLCSATLPSLTNLLIDSGTVLPYPFPHNDFASFLARHPKIRRLSLQVIGPSSPVEEMRTLNLAALEVFSGHPSSARWLTSRLRPAGVPMLRTFITATKSTALQCDPVVLPYLYVCDDVNEALDKLAVVTSLVGEGSDFVLGLNFRDGVTHRDMIRFFRDHSSDSEESAPTKIIQALRGVRAVRILFMPGFSHGEEVLSSLAGFVDTFPDVQRLECVGLRAHLSYPSCSAALEERTPPRDSDETIRAFLQERCSKLKSVQFLRAEVEYFESFSSLEDAIQVSTSSEPQSNAVFDEPGLPLVESEVAAREPGHPA